MLTCGSTAVSFAERENPLNVVCQEPVEFAVGFRHTQGMSSNAENLARHVKARREQLEISQLDVWQAGGPSNTTLTVIENGRLEKLTRTTARRLEAGLQWDAGSARRAWEGGEPTPVLRPQLSPKGSAWLREQIRRAEGVDEGTRDALVELLDEQSRGA